MTCLVTVRHNFETAHRLPTLGGKCTSLHGHSWWAEVTVAGPQDRTGCVIEFGHLKRDLRSWIDQYLDHGTMLGVGDPLLPYLVDAGCKVYRFGSESPATFAEVPAMDMHWPTVENVAVLLARVSAAMVEALAPAARVAGVRVTETHVNAAEVIL